MRQKPARIPRPLVHRFLAYNLNLTAQRNRGDAIVSLAPAKAEQTLPKADGEYFDPNLEQFGRCIVAELMDQNHESQNHRDGHDRTQMRHKFQITPNLLLRNSTH